MGQETGIGKIYSEAPLGELCFGPSGNEKSQYVLDCHFKTLEDILLKHEIDIVKMDCEGAEMFMEETPLELLKGLLLDY
ncbi:MAG: FkbM family methyltransferase [Parachlamydiaceae bacterium]|nr:MAG: FkbM family methyltransferase [Parachlamydiaceae bacterium]